MLTFPVRFAGLPEAGGTEGGRGLLRCFVQFEQVHWLRATRPVCRATEEERPIRNRLGQVGGTVHSVECSLQGFYRVQSLPTCAPCPDRSGPGQAGTPLSR